MAVKDILLALTSYPEPTPVSAVDEAIAFTVALGARISAIACEVKMRVPGSPLGTAFLNIPAMAAAEAKKSSTNAEKSRRIPGCSGETRGLPGANIGAVSDIRGLRIARRICPTSRLRIVPVPEGDYVEQGHAESIIFGSGRPTLIYHTRGNAPAPLR